ncbi:hypothetical protein [Psychroserpens sp. Hel_I_66]|uniref:hypothetical protein n=1 Tax=Psychroserpens sp. Hel_I_66 TaxID=1250004 RepID=UPI0006483F97|nr:hypothetical protein [Psychroserpens sp. Hel_I_66]
MHKKITLGAFQKAKENEQKKGARIPSKNRLSKVLSDYIFSEMNFSIGERSLKNYFDKSLEIKETNEDINIAQLDVVNGLCRYLGYKNYEDYILNSKKNNDNDVNDIVHIDQDGESTNIDKLKNKTLFARFRSSSALNKLLIIVFSIIVLVIITIPLSNTIGNQTRWMVWQEDHYVEVEFDAEKYNVNQLKLFKEERIRLFKKISPDCLETIFFNGDGSVNIWYGKNKDKKLEYFTALGLHPQTGKSLKPITHYMIDKYICN